MQNSVLTAATTYAGPPFGNKKTMKVPEVAELLDVSPWTIYESVKRGDFPLKEIRVGLLILFPTVDALRLVGHDSANSDAANQSEQLPTEKESK